MTLTSELGSQCSAGLRKLIGRSVGVDVAGANHGLSFIELHEQRRLQRQHADKLRQIEKALPTVCCRYDNNDLDQVLLDCPEPELEKVEPMPTPPVTLPSAPDEIAINLDEVPAKSNAPTLQPSSELLRCRRISSAAHRLSTLLLASRYRQRSLVCDDVEVRAHLVSLYDDDHGADLRALLCWFSTRFRTTLSADELMSKCSAPRACIKRQLVAIVALGKANVAPSISSMLFTALCRALGRRARLVAALHPLPTASVKLNERFQLAESVVSESSLTPCPCQIMFESPYFRDEDDRPISKKQKCTNRSRFDCWVEVHDKGRWVPVSLLQKKIDDRTAFEALLVAPPTYIISIDERRRIVDVVKRYAASWAAVLKRTPARAWWQETLQNYARRYPHADDHGEECAELDAFADDDRVPTKLDEFRNHPKYAIKKFLKKYEVVYPDDEPIGEFKGHAIYNRALVHTLHSKENWLREPMRRVRDDELPFKKVKSRSRKLDADEMQSLYGIWQTEPWNPEPVLNGVVPTSMYGHCELWTDMHLPPGAVHLKQPRIAMAARKCKVHFAPAMLGFESGTMGSIPIIQGVVTAVENKDPILTVYQAMEARRLANIEKRRLEMVQSLWRALVKGTIVRHQILVEKHSVLPNREDSDDRKHKTQRVRIVPEQHVHDFQENLDPDTNIWTSRCSCGFICEEEDI